MNKQTITPTELRSLVASGKLKANHSHGEIEVKKSVKSDLPEFQRYKHLAKKGIAFTDASETYAINPRTLTNWIKRGWIPVVGTGDDARVTLLDEQHVAYCADVYQKHGGPGKRVFNPDGTPYTPKSLALEGAGA